MNKVFDRFQFKGHIKPGQMYSLSIYECGVDAPLAICTVRTKREARDAVNMLITMLDRCGGQFKRCLGIEKLCEAYHPQQTFVIRLLFNDKSTGVPGIIKLRFDPLLTFDELVECSKADLHFS